MSAQESKQSSENPVTHVAVGVVEDERGRILIAQRAAHLHQGGRWEFPGGKVETGESIEQAVTRELREELDIQVTQARPLITLHHDYPDKSVYLDVWLIEAFEGEARGREGQTITWIEREGLGQYRFPDANRAIVHCLQLPSRYLITGAHADLDDLLRRLRGALESGIRLVQFRAPELDDETYAARAEALVSLAHRYGASCLLNRRVEVVKAINAAGVHLNSTTLMNLEQRPLAEDKWVAASVHNEPELRQAQRIGVDFVAIGAVAATASHPGREPLGWREFGALVREANIPCYALGGMTEQDLSHAQQLGAQGIAAIRAWWAA